MGVGGQSHFLAALPPGKTAGSHRAGGLMGHKVGVDGCGKSRPPPEFVPPTVQPVASRCTNFAIRARRLEGITIFKWLLGNMFGDSGLVLLAQNRDKLWAVVNNVMTVVPKGGEFL